MRKTWDDQFPVEGVMDVEEASLRKTSSINQEPFLQLVLPVIDGVSLLVEEVHDKFYQLFFEAILVRISLISENTVLMCNDFLLWWLVETSSNSPRRSS